MSLEFKQVKEITIQNIEELIENAVQEGKKIEYKSQLSIDSDSEKGEFLADISSFANTEGGVYIAGIQEEEKVPTKVVGCIFDDIDKIGQKIDNILSVGIEPRLYYEHHFIEFDQTSKKYLFIIKIFQSFNQPHRVIYKASSKHKNEFYGRNSSGKYQLDTNELSFSFRKGRDLKESVIDVRNQRIMSIKSNNLPILIDDNTTKFVIHLIPFNLEQKVNLHLMQEDHNLAVRPLLSSGRNSRTNLDGFIAFSGNEDGGVSQSYTLAFRNGMLEMYTSKIIGDRDGSKILFSQDLEESFTHSMRSHLNKIIILGLQFPIYLSASLLSVKGSILGVDWAYRLGHYPCDRNDLILDGAVISSVNDVDEGIKYLLDQIRQAYGYMNCFSFPPKKD